MKILKKNIKGKNSCGSITFSAEEAGDMYHLYNIIMEGDLITGSTVRNVVKETATGSVKNRMWLRVTLRVVKGGVQFDAEQSSLRVRGVNVAENEHIKMGQYHTLELTLNEVFTLEKEGAWDAVHLQRLRDASDPAASRKADVLAVVLQEGLAHVCLVSSTMTVTKGRIEKKFPKKNHESYPRALERFFAEIYAVVAKFADFGAGSGGSGESSGAEGARSGIKLLVVGSPGFWNADLLNYMMEASSKQAAGGGGAGSSSGSGAGASSSSSSGGGGVPPASMLHRHRDKVVLCRASSGHKAAVAEILEDPQLATQLADVKAVADVQALAEFHSMLSTDQDRACYSMRDVLYADEMMAVDKLLITDKLLHTSDFDARKKYIDLMEAVAAHRGTVRVLNSLHSSGAQLDLYTGVAAILRFPLAMPDLPLPLPLPPAPAPAAAPAAAGANGDRKKAKVLSAKEQQEQRFQGVGSGSGLADTSDVYLDGTAKEGDEEAAAVTEARRLEIEDAMSFF